MKTFPMKTVTIRTRQNDGKVLKKTTVPKRIPKKITTFHYEGDKGGQ